MATAVAIAPGYATLTAPALVIGKATLFGRVTGKAQIVTAPPVAAAGSAVVGTSIVG